MGLRFFGLTSSYRPIVFDEIFSLTYHGNGGFNYWDVYHMPIWLRRYNIRKINDIFEKQKEEYDKQNQQLNNNTENQVAKPNIPTSKFNFKG